MGIKTNGFKELEKKLSKLQKNAEKIKGENSIEFSKLFNGKFLSKHSSFTSWEDLVEKSSFKINSSEDFAAIPNDEWERFITENTSFSSWKDMQVEASKEWTLKELGF